MGTVCRAGRLVIAILLLGAAVPDGPQALALESIAPIDSSGRAMGAGDRELELCRLSAAQPAKRRGRHGFDIAGVGLQG